jgi:DNA-binding MarR family transcriptional regulator
MRRKSAREQNVDRREVERAGLISARAFIDDMRSRYIDLEKLTGASISMHRALACVAATPGVSASSLATTLGMKRPALSHILKGLAERGWIERLRAPMDQRAVQLHLSAAGKQTVEATAGRAVGTLQRAIARLSDDEVMCLSAGLAALLRELPAAPRAPAKGKNV